MKKIILTFLILLSACCSARAVDIPPRPDGYVTDRAHLYDGETGGASAIERELAAFERKTSCQIFVFTFPSLENEPIENVSIKVAEKWKAGQKGKDNGVIILIARDERKIRIEVGYGLEGVVPDILASRIINEYMLPEFRQGRFVQGTRNAVKILEKAVEGEYFGKGAPGATEDIVITKEAIIGMLTWAFTIIAVFFFLTVPVDIAGYNKYKRRNRVFKELDPYLKWWLKASIFIIVLHFLLRIFFEILINVIFSKGYGIGGHSGGGHSGGGGRFGGGGASGGW